MPRLTEGVVIRIEQRDDGTCNIRNVGEVVQSVGRRD
jgi:hypothetical protein